MIYYIFEPMGFPHFKKGNASVGYGEFFGDDNEDYDDCYAIQQEQDRLRNPRHLGDSTEEEVDGSTGSAAVSISEIFSLLDQVSNDFDVLRGVVNIFRRVVQRKIDSPTEKFRFPAQMALKSALEHGITMKRQEYWASLLPALRQVLSEERMPNRLPAAIQLCRRTAEAAMRQDVDAVDCE